MKALKFSLLLAFLASPIFIFTNFRPKPKQPMQATIHAEPALNRLRVIVSKPEDSFFVLRITDEKNGWLLHEQSFATGSSTVQANVNLCSLPNGRYRVEISGEDEMQANLVHLSPSQHPSFKRQISIWTIG